jgi:ABC-type glycerol-3-phosphate transport system permease component
MIRRAAAWTLSLLVAWLFLIPLIWMVHASFRPESAIFEGGMGGLFSLDGLHLSNYADAWRRARFGTALVNSLLQVIGIIGIGLLINSAAAFAFARLRFAGRDLLFTTLVICIILPVEVLVIPLFLTARDLHLTGGYGATMAGLIIPFSAKAINVFFLRQHFLALPSDLEEAARVDGASWLMIYWRIALPSIRPALATVIVLDVLTHWSDFIWPLVLCTREETRTVQISLANLFTQPPIQWGAILACAVLATLPVLLIFRLAQRHIVTNQLHAGIK